MTFPSFKSNQLIFIGLRSSKNYYNRPGGGVGMGGCVLREWVMEGGGLYGYFGEQGLPAEFTYNITFPTFRQNVYSLRKQITFRLSVCIVLTGNRGQCSP